MTSATPNLCSVPKYCYQSPGFAVGGARLSKAPCPTPRPRNHRDAEGVKTCGEGIKMILVLSIKCDKHLSLPISRFRRDFYSTSQSKRCICYGKFVRLFVSPSHSAIVSKQGNAEGCGLHHRVG